MSTTYRTINPGPTHRATAEAIYQHLLDHPKDIPTGTSDTTFLLGSGGPACVKVTHANGVLTAYPCTTCSIQTERSMPANYLGADWRGETIETIGLLPREDAVHRLRVVVARTVRHHAAEEERVAARIAKGETERAEEEARAGSLVHLHVPSDAPRLAEVLNSIATRGARVIRDCDSYREWGEPVADGDPEHVVVQIHSQKAESAFRALAAHGVPVDASLADDWASRLTWGYGPAVAGWADRYRAGA